MKKQTPIVLIYLCCALPFGSAWAAEKPESAGIDVTKDSIDTDQVSWIDDQNGLTVMAGVFTVGESKTIPKNGKIKVYVSNTDQLVGLYRPNKKTGKYLLILPSDKSYKITFEAAGSQYKSENLIVPESTSFNRVKQKIDINL